MGEELIGVVEHYFGRPQVAAFELTGDLAVGDTIHIVGATSDFTQKVKSIEIEHEAVESASAGDNIGIQVGERARVHDQVFRVTSG